MAACYLILDMGMTIYSFLLRVYLIVKSCLAGLAYCQLEVGTGQQFTDIQIKPSQSAGESATRALCRDTLQLAKSDRNTIYSFYQPNTDVLYLTIVPEFSHLPALRAAQAI